MYPKLFSLPAFDLFGRTIGPLTLHAYGVLLAIAFITGLWVASRQAKKAGLDSARVTDMAVYVLIAGLIGAKVLLVVVEWNYYARNPRELLSILQSGGVFYGGLIGAFPVAWWYARKHGLPPWRTADVLAPAVALGQAIGRLGCFCAGCCYGRAANVPWAVTFRDAYASRTVGTPLDTAVHPTQIYEALACLAIFFVLIRMARAKRFDGQVTLAYVLLYAVVRFVIEFYRGDAVRGTVFGVLSTSQFIALLMAVAVAFVFPYLAKRNRVTPPAAPAPA
jgi:phosphatidylglycerol---prolipoprotein diacylglyceryl transferase